MTRYFLLVAACLMSIATAQAQPVKDSVEIEIEAGRISLDAGDLENLSGIDLNTMIKDIIEKTNKVQKQQKELLAKVDQQFANGEITEEEAEVMREAINERTEESMQVIGELMENWGESYGEYWEEWAAEYEAGMEEWSEKMENRSDIAGQPMPPIPPLPPMPPIPSMPNIPALPPAPGVSDEGSAPSGEAEPDTTEKGKKIIISDDEVTIHWGKDDKWGDDEKKSNRTIERTETYVDLHFGFNQLLESGQYLVLDEPGEMDPWKSNLFEFGIGGKTRLGSPYSKFYLKWGGEISWHSFRFGGNNFIEKSAIAERTVFRTDTIGFSKSKYSIAYLNLPIMLQLDLSDVGERDESLTFGLGGYFGVRIDSDRTLKYNDFEGRKVKEEVDNDFYTRPIRYGVMAQIGWESLKITAKYDLSEFFKDTRSPLNVDGLPGEYQLASVSIGFTL